MGFLDFLRPKAPRNEIPLPWDLFPRKAIPPDRMAGVEVAPHEAYWQELSPILAMYCYGPAALLAGGELRSGSASRSTSTA